MRVLPCRARLLALLCAAAALAACSPRLTRVRRGWHDCRVDPDHAIFCAGRPMAQVECTGPHDQACSALSVRYTDGQRVYLAGLSYEPDPRLQWQRPEQIEVEDESALSPEIAADASAIWYGHSGTGERSGWKVFDPSTGLVRETDRTGILLLRARVIDYQALWKAP